ncbi:MAG TPA: peptidoglycan editing factor PgeF [Steroidobacteraceae bacterium]|nr:peptidoglycan editing factor PgeF [Steroidobacteraceae bacterium]
MSPVGWLAADWPAPPGVRAGVTTRVGGISTGPFATLNLAAHVGDDPAAVATNRTLLSAALALPAEPLWLRQVHGTAVVVHDGAQAHPEADAAVTFVPGRVLAVLVADCLPVVIASRDGARLGLAHAGWRGLAGGVIEATVRELGVAGADLVAWLGPGIGPAAFEVGAEVRAAFTDRDPAAAEAFAVNPRGRWQADLYRLARQRLARLGVQSVSGGDACTFADAERFYSYRRNATTGRMATLAWLVASGDAAGARATVRA